MHYTPDEMVRLNAEWARVKKLQAADRIAAEKVRRERNERNLLLEEQKQKEREEYWAQRKKENDAFLEACRVRAVRSAELQAARDARTERDHERERRSRIKWSEIIDDEYTVKRQIAWERRATALAMRNGGLSFVVIGERLGVTRGRAQQLAAHAERERSQPWRRSPAEAWMADAPIARGDCIHPRMRVTLAALAPRQETEADWIWMGLAA